MISHVPDMVRYIGLIIFRAQDMMENKDLHIFSIGNLKSVIGIYDSGFCNVIYKIVTER